MVNNFTNSTEFFLLKNCRVEWPNLACIFFNICGLCSTAVWFVVLVPQVWKNYVRKSVAGLSIIWATTNFAAAAINIFFVFGIGTLPLYIKINSVYMPVLEALILLQFYIYDKKTKTKKKLIYGASVIVGFIIVAVTNLVFGIYYEMQWLAILLWSIETFPQVILNMRRHSTSGQSTGSVALAQIGKTTDFLSVFGLVMPQQFIVMTYYSTSLAYINGVQVIWYFHKSYDPTSADLSDEDNANFKDLITAFITKRKGTDLAEGVPVANSHTAQITDNGITDNGITDNCITDNGITDNGEKGSDNGKSDAVFTDEQVCYLRRFKQTRIINATRYGFMFLLSCLLILLSISIVWAMHSYIAVLAPMSVIFVLLTAKIIIVRMAKRDGNRS